MFVFRICAVASFIQCLWYLTAWNCTVCPMSIATNAWILLPFALIFQSKFEYIHLISFLLCRIGGSGIDVRSKARVRSFIHIMSFWIMTYISSCDWLQLNHNYIAMMRSLEQTVKGPITSASQLPKWNYDGSSTGQAPGEDSEVIL